MENRTVRSLVNTFLAWASQRLRPSTVNLYRHYLEQFAGVFGERPIDQVQRLDVETFAQRKHPLEVIRRFFRWCVVNAQAAELSPCEGIEVPRSGRRSRILSRLERVRLRRRAGVRLRALVVALEETACRPLEARQLAWEQLRTVGGVPLTRKVLEGGSAYFELVKYKGQSRRRDKTERRFIAISPRLGRLLWRMRSRLRNVTGSVFTSPSGRAWTANALRCAWRRLVTAVARIAAVDLVGLVPYLYRHTKATELAAQGTHGRLLADFLGHSGLEMQSVYVHLKPADLCQVLRGVVTPKRIGEIATRTSTRSADLEPGSKT